MDSWVYFALLSMLFAGVTSVLAKIGLQSIHADLGMGIRTAFIFLVVAVFMLFNDRLKDIHLITTRQWMVLAASGLTAALSWIFYFRAIKSGPLTYVAVIDKGSLVVTLVLAFLIFREPLTPKIALGAGLVFAGMLVLVIK